MNIYVGNLPHATTEAELREAFEEFGTVSSAAVIKDKLTGKSRGFGFVEMPDRSEAEDAIENLNGHEFGGRRLTVNEARPREDRRGGSGSARRGSGEYRGGYGGGRNRGGYGGGRRDTEGGRRSD